MPEARFITRPIKKQLKEQGFDLLNIDEKDFSKFDEAMNAALNLLYPELIEEFDKKPYGELQKLFQDCMERTFPTTEIVGN